MQNIWKREASELLRGVAAGFLFSIPLFFTMEMWAIGSYASAQHTLVVLAVSLLGIFGLNYVAGFRSDDHQSVLAVVLDTFTVLALSVLCSTCLLFVLKEVTQHTPFMIILRQAVYGAVPFAMGMGLANNYLQPKEADEEAAETFGSATLADMVATLLGALFLGFNIAPTEEVRLVAAFMSAQWLMVLVAFSIGLSYLIVFVARFGDQQTRHSQTGLFQHPWTETVFSYGVSLVVAALMLWFFEQLTFADHWSIWLAHSIVLALPTTIGGAAGRLVV